MIDVLRWSLRTARRRTLDLVEGIAPEEACHQAEPGEPHPTWTVGHLLLSDRYLLSLLGDPLAGDFDLLLERHGPDAAPVADAARYPSLQILAEGLRFTGRRRDEILRDAVEADLDRPLPDPTLARAQPTLRHHLHALAYHEGHHAGRLTAWRRRRGMPAVAWAHAVPLPEPGSPEP